MSGCTWRGGLVHKPLSLLGLLCPRQREASASAVRADGALDHFRCVLILGVWEDKIQVLQLCLGLASHASPPCYGIPEDTESGPLG
eukprot:8507856-Prorocentrum_lima.AAC.1